MCEIKLSNFFESKYKMTNLKKSDLSKFDIRRESTHPGVDYAMRRFFRVRSKVMILARPIVVQTSKFVFMELMSSIIIVVPTSRGSGPSAMSQI